jgi:hypothetical protein
VHNRDLQPEYHLKLFGVVKEDWSHNYGIPADTLDSGLKLTSTITKENIKYSIELLHSTTKHSYGLVYESDPDEVPMRVLVDYDYLDLKEFKEILLGIEQRMLTITTLDGQVLENVAVNSLTHSVDNEYSYRYQIAFTDFIIAEVELTDIKITRKKKRHSGKAKVDPDKNKNKNGEDDGKAKEKYGDQLAHPIGILVEAFTGFKTMEQTRKGRRQSRNGRTLGKYEQ